MIFPANAKRCKAVFPHALHSAAWGKRNGTEFVSMNRPRAKNNHVRNACKRIALMLQSRCP